MTTPTVDTEEANMAAHVAYWEAIDERKEHPDAAVDCAIQAYLTASSPTTDASGEGYYYNDGDDLHALSQAVKKDIQHTTKITEVPMRPTTQDALVSLEHVCTKAYVEAMVLFERNEYVKAGQFIEKAIRTHHSALFDEAIRRMRERGSVGTPYGIYNGAVDDMVAILRALHHKERHRELAT